jgi:ferredoxin
MLVINPNECIDCGVCVPECPIDAIIPDTVEGADQWVELNQRLAQSWPVITKEKAPPADADEWKHKKDKLPLLIENWGE